MNERGNPQLTWRLAVLVAAALGVLVWTAFDAPSTPAVGPREASTRSADAWMAMPQPVADGSIIQARTPAAPIAACPRGSLRWQGSGGVGRACLAVEILVSDSGSLRSYRLDSLQGNARWLRIDTAGGRVVAAAAGDGQGGEYGCQADACRGVAIGERDLQDMRRIAIDGLSLRLDGGVASTLRLSGRFEVDDRAEDNVACAGQRVAVSRGDGVLTSFCPDDGTGSSVGDDGSPSYRFADREGRVIAVQLDAQGALLGIGSGDAVCAGADCFGATLSAPNAEGARELQLRGTMLMKPSGWVQLDGVLLLPS